MTMYFIFIYYNYVNISIYFVIASKNFCLNLCTEENTKEESKHLHFLFNNNKFLFTRTTT